jgi:hypothetical protein
VGFLWFGATPLGMLGGELDGPTSAFKPGEPMSNITAHLRSKLSFVVIASALSMSLLAADHEVRIGRYQTIGTETRCEQARERVAPEPVANPDKLVPRAEASLEPDVAVTFDSNSTRTALSIVDQAKSVADKSNDEE